MPNDWDQKKYDEMDLIHRELLSYIMGLAMGVGLGLIAGFLLFG